MADKKLSKDELKKVSGGTVYRAKVSVQKVRNKPGAGTQQTPRARGRGRA